MPKSPTNPAAGILNYFRKAPLDQAELVLDLSRDAVRQRRALGAKIRSSAAAGAAANDATPAPAPKAKRRGRKPGPKPGARKRSASTGEVQMALPPQTAADEALDAAE